MPDLRRRLDQIAQREPARRRHAEREARQAPAVYDSEAWERGVMEIIGGVTLDAGYVADFYSITPAEAAEIVRYVAAYDRGAHGVAPVPEMEAEPEPPAPPSQPAYTSPALPERFRHLVKVKPGIVETNQIQGGERWQG